ncbi:MAG: hypothetical protein HY689_13890 [Chloroflexi bacterium]|nr:hypothetical protein [Chloroflexota bacterium]
MTVLDEATKALSELEAELLQPTQEHLDSTALAERIRAVRRLLSKQETRWVGTTAAKRLLALGSENTVKVWARMGLLRSRRLPNGRIQVLLDDVLRRREETEGLSAIGGEDLTREELQALREDRPGRNPWEREKANPAQ